MKRTYSTLPRLAKPVMFIITLAFLWVQSVGLNHSIQHGLSNFFKSAEETSKLESLGVLVKNGGGTTSLQPISPSNPSSKHNCFAWESCSVTTAVFTTHPLILEVPFLFALRELVIPWIIAYKSYPPFLSRAPPKTLNASL